MGFSPSFFAARLFVNLSLVPEQVLSPINRIQLISDALDTCFNKRYPARSVRSLCNLLGVHREFVTGVLLVDAYDVLVQRFAVLSDQHPNMKLIHSISLLPFTKICIDCHRALSNYVSKPIRIICGRVSV